LGERERSALWRAELVSRSVLVGLGNAADAEQGRPLLPGATESLILITRPPRVTDLAGAHAPWPAILPPPRTLALFTAVVGERAPGSAACCDWGDPCRWRFASPPHGCTTGLSGPSRTLPTGCATSGDGWPSWRPPSAGWLPRSPFPTNISRRPSNGCSAC